MPDFIDCPCITVKQPIGTFFVVSISADDLLAISYADIRRPEGRDIERYIGIQRDLSHGRVSEIRQYVTTLDACFPSSIILSVSEVDAEYDSEKKLLRLRRADNVAKIIYGQHRIAGLEAYGGTEFELNVTVFVDMDIEDQAMVFATINIKQTKVSKSLAYDLFEFAERPSPQKTGHNIAKLLNFREGSPFRNRIKILGKAQGDNPEMQVLTQATVVDRILKYISRDPMDDQDQIKRGISLRWDPKDRDRLIFRGRFIDGKDAEIAKIVWNYFSSIADRWPQAWSELERGQVLARTTGFAAFMRALRPLWVAMGSPTTIPGVSDFRSYLDRVQLVDADFTTENFKPGSTGEGELVRRIVAQMNLEPVE
jgi:DGQHR domain-containing protein